MDNRSAQPEEQNLEVSVPEVIKNKRSLINSRIQRCGKQRRGGKGPCRAVMMKNGRGCRLHGGTAQVGLKVHNFMSGRYSKRLAELGMLDVYERALTDTRILELNDEIGLVETLMDEAFQRIQDSENLDYIALMTKCYNDMIQAQSTKSWVVYNARFAELGKLLEKSTEKAGALESMKSLIKLRMNLNESQSKREAQLSQMMRAEDVMLLIKVLLHEIRGVVYDRFPDREKADALMMEVSEKVAMQLRGRKALTKK